MSANLSKIKKKGRGAMNADAQTMLRGIAYKRWPASNQKARVWRLSRLLGWQERRTKALFYNERGMRVRAEEMAALDALTNQEVKNEFTELRARLARLETALAVSDAAFHRPQIDALGQQIRRSGGMDRPGNKGE